MNIYWMTLRLNYIKTFYPNMCVIIFFIYEVLGRLKPLLKITGERPLQAAFCTAEKEFQIDLLARYGCHKFLSFLAINPSLLQNFSRTLYSSTTGRRYWLQEGATFGGM